jgi:sarcosine oxidase
LANHFDFIIVGRGMTGAAAARHLAGFEKRVALVGPGEPEEKASHRGVFGSHYDEGRITRTLDRDPVWGRLAARSIARYGEIERESGIRFHEGRGCLYIASEPQLITSILDVARAEAASAEHLGPEALRARFPFFSFPETCAGVFEPGPAGHVSPRRLVAAQTRLAEKTGVTVISAVVDRVRESERVVTVTLRDGATVTAERVLVATGGYSIANGLLPDPLALNVYGRTILFFEVDVPEANRLSEMPSLIAKVRSPDDEIYLLPPIAYPDGRVRLKIGGEPDDHRLDGEEAIGDWFRSSGRPEAITHLAAAMERRVPKLRATARSSATCVTTFTRSGHLMIGWAGKRIAVMTGGCGAAAKSSDEIGRLGATLLRQGTLEGEGYPDVFGVEFA